MNRDDAWQGHFNELQEYYETHGKLPRRDGSSDQLVRWLRNQRKLYHTGRLPLSRVKRLQLVPDALKEGVYQSFETKLKSLRNYVRVHCHLPPQRKLSEVDGQVAQFYWYMHREGPHLVEKTAVERYRLFLSVVEDVPAHGRRAKYGSLDIVERYCQEHGHRPISSDAPSETRSMSQWLYQQERRLQEGRLGDASGDELMRIRKILEYPTLKQFEWTKTAEYVATHVRLTGELPKSTDTKAYEWYLRQRRLHRNGKLSDHQTGALIGIPGLLEGAAKRAA